jgi:hypothetical protein
VEFNQDLLRLLQSLAGFGTNTADTNGTDDTDGASPSQDDNTGENETHSDNQENFNFENFANFENLGNLGGLEGLGNIDFDFIMKMSTILSKFGENDKNSALLQALRLHMRDENKYKIDNAIKIMKILSLIPILKEAGLLGKLF